VIYQLLFSDQAAKDIKRLDQKLQRRVLARTGQLAENPFNPRVSKWLAATDDRTSRVGDWRIIYRIDQQERKIWILAVRSRGRAYRS
jgi:mRNA interferase RelE/StbE